MLKILGKCLRHFLNLFYPLRCFVCHSPLLVEAPNGEYLCHDCFKKINFITYPVCEKCGRPSNVPVCSQCNKNPGIFFDSAFHVAVYDGVFRELIHLFKYGKNDYLDKFLAGFLTETISRSPLLKESDFIIPVPLHWQEKWKRGYNQTELLSYEVSRQLRIPVLSGRLVKHKKIFSQTTLSGKERLKNVKGAFKVRNFKDFENKKILLLDDVFTTGATVNECARELRRAKARQINVITLACSCEI